MTVLEYYKQLLILIADYFISSNISMSKGKIAAAPTKNAFDPKTYVKGTITEEEVVAIKTAFDLFDTDQGGSIDIKGISTFTQN